MRCNMSKYAVISMRCRGSMVGKVRSHSASQTAASFEMRASVEWLPSAEAALYSAVSIWA